MARKPRLENHGSKTTGAGTLTAGTRTWRFILCGSGIQCKVEVVSMGNVKTLVISTRTRLTSSEFPFVGVESPSGLRTRHR